MKCEVWPWGQHSYGGSSLSGSLEQPLPVALFSDPYGLRLLVSLFILPGHWAIYIFTPGIKSMLPSGHWPIPKQVDTSALNKSFKAQNDCFVLVTSLVVDKDSLVRNGLFWFIIWGYSQAWRRVYGIRGVRWLVTWHLPSGNRDDKEVGAATKPQGPPPMTQFPQWGSTSFQKVPTIQTQESIGNFKALTSGMFLRWRSCISYFRAFYSSALRFCVCVCSCHWFSRWTPMNPQQKTFWATELEKL